MKILIHFEMAIKQISKKVLSTNEKVFARLLNLYPAFFFFGATVKFEKNFLGARIRLPLRWYYRNGHGTFFGGAILAVSDPFPAIMLSKALPWAKTWTKSHSVDFLKPGKTTLYAHITIQEEDIASAKEALETEGKYIKTFEYYFKNKDGDEIALIKSTVYMGNPKHERISMS